MSIVLRALAALLFIGIPSVGITKDERTNKEVLAPDSEAIFAYVKEHELGFYSEIEEFAHAVVDGNLVRLDRLDVYDLVIKTGIPFAHPEVAIFAKRLGLQYADEKPTLGGPGCGKLMTTKNWQNAAVVDINHLPSFYSSGLIIDIATTPSAHQRCKEWLELSLVTLEKNGRIYVSGGIGGYTVAVRVVEYRSWLDANTGD